MDCQIFKIAVNLGPYFVCLSLYQLISPFLLPELERQRGKKRDATMNMDD